MRKMGGAQVRSETVEVAIVARLRETFAPRRTDVAFVGKQPFARGDRTQAQIEIRLAFQARRGGGDLVEQGGADLARTDQADRQGLRRQPERGVRRAQGLGSVVAR